MTIFKITRSLLFDTWKKHLNLQDLIQIQKLQTELRTIEIYQSICQIKIPLSTTQNREFLTIQQMKQIYLLLKKKETYKQIS